ncbi:FAD-dependent oxidoreductase [Blautia sp.]|uniref:FAD-dependent oxidoreductase n=1 Tax=Blautia sp. TaxID=1955243 RepID=UPI003AB5BD15
MGNPRAFLTIHRQEAGYRPVHERIDDFSEVEQTLNSGDRRTQASRCMDCGVPFCHWACPLGNKQPEWQDLLYKGRYKEAYHVLEQTDDFPEFTGRVCPALCEKSCVLKLSCDEPVTIRENEAAIVEAAFREGYVQPIQPVRNGKKVAVIGSGPAGLTVANQLNRKGYEVTVFEKDELPGGLLRFGIPNFKLGKHIIDRRIRIMELWSYHFPFVPIKATSNSSSIAGTGISNPYTSSLIPSLYVTVSVVGSRTSAPSFCASSAFPTKRFTIFLEARLTWIVILPSFTVRVPFPSFASFTWNIPLSVSNSAV